jgi:hypothetical protein
MTLSFPNPGLMPSQWRDMHRQTFLTAEQRLYFAILEDAIRAIVKKGTNGMVATEKNIEDRKRDALAWIAGGHARVKFEEACDVLGIDARWLRRALDNNDAILIKRRGYDSVLPLQRLSGTGRTINHRRR